MLLPSCIGVIRVLLLSLYLVVGYSPWVFSAIVILWSVHVVPGWRVRLHGRIASGVCVDFAYDEYSYDVFPARIS